MKKRVLNSLLAGTIVVGVVVAYMTSLSGVFLFDDFQSIFNNPKLVEGGIVFPAQRWLVDLTFRLNLSMGSGSELSFHVVNILIHICNSLLVFGIALPAVGRLGFVKRGGVGKSLIAWSIAIVWGVHPLNTQAVTYICQRYESLNALFMLGALYCFALGVESSRRQRALLNLALVCLLLSTGCKESMVILPIVLLAYDYTFCERSFSSLVRERGLFHIASFMTILVLLVNEVNGGNRVGELSALSYLYNQGLVILYYLKLAVWPVGLCFDYMWPTSGPGALGILAVLVNIVLFSISIMGVFRKKALGFLGCAFYLFLAPTSSLIPVADLAVEHRMYVPLIAVVACVISILNLIIESVSRAGLFRKARTAMMFATAILFLVVVLGLKTSTRNMYYWSECAMWQDVCTKRPSNLRARNDLAAAFSAKGAVDEALAEYYEVINRVPDDVKNRCDRGEFSAGSISTASPEYAYFVACANLGTMYCNEKRDYDAALVWYMRALRIAPFNPDVRKSAKNILGAFGHSESELDNVLNEAIRRSVEEYRQ